MDNWYDYQNNSISDFIKAYRESLQAQRDSNIKQLNQTRRNSQASIMGAANRRGMMYSNFPQRDKLMYDMNTYTPNLVKVNTAYQTGLDTLRNNAVTLWNKIKAYNEAIADLNAQNTGGGGGGGGDDDDEDENATKKTTSSGAKSGSITSTEKKRSAQSSASSGAGGNGFSGGGGGGGYGFGW